MHEESELSGESLKSGSEWAHFFDGHAPDYNDNCFTKNTLAEIDFLVEELGLSQGDRILDIGCGTGRHSVELARRGYQVTGVDISVGMLDVARASAAEAGVEVTFEHADACAFSMPATFDAVICLCEGAFGLLGRDGDAIEQPLSILRNAQAAMRPGAKCLFTALNGFRMARQHTQVDVEKGVFDPIRLAEESECAPREDVHSVRLRERGFVPGELRLLFELAGLTIVHIWGGTAGNWGRRQVELDEMEIMVVGRKDGA